MNLQPTPAPVDTRVARVRTLEEFRALAPCWDRLTRGVPFRSWAWAWNWWRHYGCPDEPQSKRRLFTLVVRNKVGAVIGLAPWYVDCSLGEGRVVRFFGAGEVCSDYLSVLCEPGMEAAVAAALARWLTRAQADLPGTSPQQQDCDRWDLLELTGVDAEDLAVSRLATELEARGNTVRRAAGPTCWRIELPALWEGYLARLSKDHRKQIRRAERGLLASGRVRVHRVERLADLPRAQEVLIDLHQRRRRSLGDPGAFASRRFTAFHRDVMPDLLRNGQLLLDWLELDGRPIAAEYRLWGGGVLYAYQSGISPEALEHSPGRLSHIVMLQSAIRQGCLAVDLLRGDERYKRHWRAEPRPSTEIRVVPARAAAQLRHNVWLVGNSVKQWIKNGLGALRTGGH